MGGTICCLKNLIYSSNNSSGRDTPVDDPNTASGHDNQITKTYVALYDFGTQESDELSFRAQEILNIIDSSDDNWWLAQSRQTKQEGYIPSNYIKELQIYVALRDYEAIHANELSVRAQETYYIIDSSSSGWWLAESITTKEQGFIPASCIEVVQEHIQNVTSNSRRLEYCGKIEAEAALLLSKNTEGSYIIRKSENCNMNFYLSVKIDNFVKHYPINSNKDMNTFIINTKKFSSLDHIVAFYKANFISSSTKLKLNLPCDIRIADPLWEVDRDVIQLNRKIGSGQFGEVYDATWDGIIRVAVTTRKPGTLSTDNFLEEAQIMKKLCHKHIVQLLGVCTVGEPVYIITEFMSNGSLLHYLRDRIDRDPVKLHVRVNMAAQVASGMAYLGIQNINHRDVAARNILVGENNVVKISDFGLSRLLNEDIYEPQAGTKFPFKWAAPEAISHARFTIKTDVWSFGILLYEIATHGAHPYPGLSNKDVQECVPKGYRMPKPKECPNYLYDIMMDTWKEAPEERPTFENLKVKLDDHSNLEAGEYLKSHAVL